MTIWIFFFHFTEILDNLCQDFLEKNVTTIVYLTNSELFGRSTASSQYFLQLASYLGIPVIAWNADNSGLERRVSQLFKEYFFLIETIIFHSFNWFASYTTWLHILLSRCLKRRNKEATCSSEWPRNDLRHPEIITLLNIVMISGCLRSFRGHSDEHVASIYIKS